MSIASRENQQTSFRAGVFDRRTHKRVYQLLENDLTRNRFRDFDHRSQIEVLNRCQYRRRRISDRLVHSELRIELLELANLSVGSPAQVAVPRVPQIGRRDLLETARRVEASRKLVGNRLVVYEAVFVRRADGLLIQLLSIQRRGLRCGRSRRRRGQLGLRRSQG